ncbi:unnamed protein product [Protopolystoma xenopodis]|uniref:Uncharacterized protein n=1 Tax=Protopolystoma xenopodis TaxID=117903 RepID=A0A3S5AIH8_9PLAT|nr:unnamed protein product [Protopolystoma xenopodis]
MIAVSRIRGCREKEERRETDEAVEVGESGRQKLNGLNASFVRLSFCGQEAEQSLTVGQQPTKKQLLRLLKPKFTKKTFSVRQLHILWACFSAYP